MVLDRTDVRSTMSSYGASTRPPASAYAPCEYARFYGTEPQESSPTARTWYARGQNFVIVYSEVQPGAEFSRAQQPDEYVILLPERDGAAAEVTTEDGTTSVSP
ncbi:MAG: hypothetical protein JO318_11625, partial [Chloroflexi bacterium]|nr:hypothetical protein [Chloroflexota bacterium]